MLPNRPFIRHDTFQAGRSRLARGGLNNDNVARFEPGVCRALFIGYRGLHLSFCFQWLMMKDQLRETLWPSRHTPRVEMPLTMKLVVHGMLLPPSPGPASISGDAKVHKEDVEGFVGTTRHATQQKLLRCSNLPQFHPWAEVSEKSLV